MFAHNPLLRHPVYVLTFMWATRFYIFKKNYRQNYILFMLDSREEMFGTDRRQNISLIKSDINFTNAIMIASVIPTYFNFANFQKCSLTVFILFIWVEWRDNVSLTMDIWLICKQNEHHDEHGPWRMVIPARAKKGEHNFKIMYCHWKLRVGCSSTPWPRQMPKTVRNNGQTFNVSA